MAKSVTNSAASRAAGQTRRGMLRSLGAAGIGAAAVAPLGRRVMAQAKAPVKIAFWTFENPQQRPWMHKRVKLYHGAEPTCHRRLPVVPFGDLGKKISVGFATGTAPDGFVSQDWFMPTWLDKNLLAPLDVQRLAYSSLRRFTDDFAPAFVAGAVQDGKVYGYPLWFYGFCNLPQHQAIQGSRPRSRQGLAADLGAARRGGEAADRQGRRQVHRARASNSPCTRPQWTMIQFNPILITPAASGSSQRQVHDQQRGRRQGHDGSAPRSPSSTAPRIRPNSHRHQPAAADGLAQGALLDVLVPSAAARPPSSRKIEKMLAEGYFKPVQYPRRRAGKGISTDLRLQPRRQRARAQGQAGSPARPLQVHHERPRSTAGRTPRPSRSRARPAGPTIPQ